MFIVSLTYKDIAGVDAQLAAHREFLREHYERGIFVMSGRKVPRTGGVIVAQCASRAELDAVLERDPFRRAGVADYDVTEFVPTMTADALAAYRGD